MDTIKFLENIGIDVHIAIMHNCLETVCNGLFHLYCKVLTFELLVL